MWFYVRNPFLRRVFLVIGLDFGCLALAAFLARAWSAPHLPIVPFIGALVATGFLSFLALQATGAYDLGTIGHGRRTLVSLVGTMGLGLMAAILFYFLVPAPSGTKGLLAQTAAIYLPMFVASRGVFRALSYRISKRVLIIGASDLSMAALDAIRARRGLGMEAVGFLSDDPDDQGEMIHGVPVLGTIPMLEKVARDGLVDMVVVASKNRSEHFPADQLLQLKLQGVKILSGVDLYERIAGEIYLRDLRSSHLIFADGFRMGRLGALVKRSIDVVLATIGLVVAAPVLLLAAPAIRLESRGPILFRQVRVGQHNRPFELLKLRSMSHGAESKTGPVFAKPDDARITRVGRFLRRSRIDELPQLINVLKGDMSMVGPRPERPEFIDALSQRYPYFRVRSVCKPGVTGWAQCRAGYASDFDAFEQKLALDLYYLKHQSVSMDIAILWTTTRTIFSLSGV